MSIAADQRDEIVRFTHPLSPNLRVVSARTKHNRRYRAIVAQDGDQILMEWWPPTEENIRRACLWIDGYRMGKNVWGPGA